MIETKYLLLIVIGTIAMTSIPLSEAVLWDLLITVNVQNTPLLENENPIVSGKVVDHASKPIENATIQIRSGQNNIFTTSDEFGIFSHEFTGLGLIPGEHVVNVVATTPNDKIGISSANFQVRGELSASSHTGRLLETEEARKYLNANPEDFVNNSIGITLYNYYQELQAKFLEQEKVQESIDNTNRELDETRAISDDIEQQIIEEKNPSAGTYSGFKKDVFISNLDPKIRDTISKQMNYTLDIFEEAQNAMNEVLENGGTYQEARMAYLKKAIVTKEMMEVITYGNQTLLNSNSTITQNSTGTLNATSINNSTQIESTTDEISMNLNGTEIQVGLSGTTIFLNVNGTIIEFLVNGTEIIPVTNSTEN